MASFIFGKGQEYATPEELAKARALAEAMLGPQRAPQNVGEGLTAIGQAIRGRIDMNRINAAEKAGQAGANSVMSALFRGGQFPPAPKSHTASTTSGGMEPPKGASADAIRAGLVQRGLPEHVADGFLMNFQDESGLNPAVNEASPMVPGSRGGFGLSQWTGPRRKALEAFAAQRGVPVSDVDGQLDYLMTELQGPEANAMKSIMASTDAGSAAAAIAKDFLRPAQQHLDRRVAKYLGSGSAPVQTASLDPSAGVAQAIARQAQPQAAQGQQVAQALDRLPVAAGGNADAIQPGQGGPNMQQLFEAAQNPWLNPAQRGVVQMLMEQQMQQNDPMRQMELERGRLELDALKNPKPKFDFVTGKDGSIFRTDSSGKMEQVYGGKPDKTNDVQNYEYYAEQERAAGREPAPFGGWKEAQSRAGASQVNIDQKAEGAFEKKAAEKQAETFDTMATEGLSARADIGVINELEGLLQGQGGTFSGISGALAKYGIGGEGMDDLQAAQALINKLVPTQRQPGSGSMSDRDVELFTRSLPSLWNAPGGNQKIIGVMRGLAQYKQQQGEIADQVLAGEMTRQEGRRALRELPNPLAEFAKPKEAPKSGSPTAGAVEDGYRFKGGDPSDPANWEEVR